MGRHRGAGIISLGLLSECLMYDGEHNLFTMIHKNQKMHFPNLTDHLAYNLQGMRLYPYQGKVRHFLVEHLADPKGTFVIDSMPNQVCQINGHTLLQFLNKYEFSNQLKHIKHTRL
jgi:hypothetical protein